MLNSNDAVRSSPHPTALHLLPSAIRLRYCTAGYLLSLLAEQFSWLTVHPGEQLDHCITAITARFFFQMVNNLGLYPGEQDHFFLVESATWFCERK